MDSRSFASHWRWCKKTNLLDQNAVSEKDSAEQRQTFLDSESDVATDDEYENMNRLHRRDNKRSTRTTAEIQRDGKRERNGKRQRSSSPPFEGRITYAFVENEHDDSPMELVEEEVLEDHDGESVSDESDIRARVTPDKEGDKKSPFNRDDVAIPGNVAFQIELNDLLRRHNAGLKLHDDIANLINAYIPTGRYSKKMPNLPKRESFIEKTERMFKSQNMRPHHINVTLSDKSVATLALFDLEVMIKSLLMDDTLMKEENLAEGYNIYSGRVDKHHPSNKNYGEVHTGDAWIPARNRFCGKRGEHMPIGLIVFGDKTHTDLHNTLSLTPIIFTLTLFNRKARNNPKFWRPLTYIPNLSHGKGAADKTTTADQHCQDEQACLRIAFESLRRIHNDKGMKIKVKGVFVRAMVWIHYLIGDIEGNNKWIGHLSGGKKRPYRDCKCSKDDMDLDNPRCKYITRDETRRARKRAKKATTKTAREKVFNDISKRDVRLALMDLPLSDAIHGVYRMMPPELLHTSGSGLIMYIFEVLRELFGDGVKGLKRRHILDRLHQQISAEISRQSNRDFPRGSVRNGIIDGTKCQSSERRGNLHRLLCISYTKSGRWALRRVFRRSGVTWDEWVAFLKSYLAMEEWFHAENPKDEVRSARRHIATILKNMKKIFNRHGGHGWKIPKHHGMTKMQYYMCLFGSGMNFFGGPGESHHKTFMKAPGKNTQRRVGEFAKQVSIRVYESMLIDIAKSCVDNYEDEEYEEVGGSAEIGLVLNKNDGEPSIQLVGSYVLTVESVTEDSERVGVWDGTNSVKWGKNDKFKRGRKFDLHPDLLRVLYREVKRRGVSLPALITGYTEMTMTDLDGEKDQFYAHPNFNGAPWYDWCYVHFEIPTPEETEKTKEEWYLAKILGFVGIRDNERDPDSTQHYAVVRTSAKPVSWDKLQKEMVYGFRLSTDFSKSFVLVPFASIVHPLFAYPDYGGDEDTDFFTCVGKSHWSRYFGDKIKSPQRGR